MPHTNATQSDADLINLVRGGSTAAFHVLYDRHRAAARAMARYLTRNPSEADDLVAEAFARVFAALRRQGGPTSSFRAYLRGALSNLAIEQHRRNRRITLCDDMSAYDLATSAPDPNQAEPECSAVTLAFQRLPARWQTVLWQIEVEGKTVSEVATALGLTPNAVSALVYRARAGLRQIYDSAQAA